ncbi:MAG TPA: bifunctional DNA primase/polymerase [Candidatus Acidoferrales bacterium]|nr:bifunctional DNA primase/polymerase [Candidatus Acidoferrales bacterium]
MSADRPDMLVHALAAAQRGFAVCPGLVPEYMQVLVDRLAFKNAFSVRHRAQATTDGAIVRRWFRRFPLANIMVRTGRISNLVVVDFDFRFGGRPAWERLRYELPPTLRVNTAGGVHLYFRYPEALEIPTSIRQVEVGVDVLGDLAIVAFPPSRHRDGIRYQFEDPAIPVSQLPPDFALRCSQVTPQPFWDPQSSGYAAKVTDLINMSYAGLVTIPNLFHRPAADPVARPIDRKPADVSSK